MYLALWLIRRWRLPATPCFTLPVAVSLKRFFTPLLVFSLGIFVSFCRTSADVFEQPRQPFWPGGSVSPESGRAGPIWGGGGKSKQPRGDQREALPAAG